MAIADLIEKVEQAGKDYITEKFSLGQNATPRLQYPLNQEDYKASVEFTTIAEEPVTPQGLVEDIQNLGSQLVDFGTGLFSSEDGAENEITDLNNGSEEASNALLSHSGIDNSTPTKRARERLETVSMYLMQQLQFNDNASYNNVNLNQIGALTEAGLNNSGGVVSGAISAGTSLYDAFTGGANAQAGTALARLGAAGVASKLNDQVGGAVRVATQTTLNPNARVVYENPEIRVFTFTFKLIPTSKAEAESIKKIVHFFRREVYPTEIFAAGISVGYEFPNKFEIKIKYNGNVIPGTEIADCYLIQAQTIFNPTQMGFYKDGNFNETELVLTFRETRALSKSFFQQNEGIEESVFNLENIGET